VIEMPRKKKEPDERSAGIEDVKSLGELVGSKVLVFEKSNEIYESGFYGKPIDNRLELSLVEALFLLKKEKIIVMKDGKKIDFHALYEIAKTADKRLAERYRVYEDLRERGLLVRSGFKFGCDFRVYERGVKLIKGPKSQKEHTKWTVFCVPEDYTCSFQELSRAIRLAHNIRARMLWAIVDNEGDVTYYQCVRETP
jgi:tRNA-intron endonuclease